MSKLVCPIKYSGGKNYLYKLIHDQIKSHKIWIEPFIGGGVVTWKKPPSGEEMIFDTNPHLINFYYYSKYFPNDVYNVANVPYCEDSFNWASDYETEPDFIVAAAKYLVRNRLSRDGMFNYYGWSDRPRRGMPENVSAFKNVLENWNVFIERLKNVMTIMCEDAFIVLEAFKDGKDTCFYLDPPYPLESRPSKKLYGKYEVAKTTEDDIKWHQKFLNLALACKGQCIISSYRNSTYDTMLSGWKIVEKPITVKMGGTLESGKKSQRIEALYINR